MTTTATPTPGKMPAAFTRELSGPKQGKSNSVFASLLLVLVAGFAGGSAFAQDPPHLSFLQPGGMPGLPVMTGIQAVTNGLQVTWYGPPGYYQLFQNLNLKSQSWQAVGGLNLSNAATVAAVHSNAFFRVSGPAPRYAGWQACAECHGETHDSVVLTPHARAFTNALFISTGGQTNASCLPCHTVGAGLPTGFVSLAKTPQLAGVQCESCHGPAAVHAANPEDPSTRPHVEIAATLCGGCHNSQYVPAAAAAYHAPRYEEWDSSAHRAARDELKNDFATTPSMISSCGRCHSGTVREAFLENTPLPNGHEAGAVGVACATCHEPHELVVHANVLNGVRTNAPTGGVVTNTVLGAVYTNQLRNPLASTNDYFLTTSDVFSNKYNPDINICGQCHNHRGAQPSDTSRPPHHSPQYNLLLGTVGVLPPGTSTNQSATHTLLEKQCVTCHMQTQPYVSAAQPAVTGHAFTVVSYEVCAKCHGSAQNAQNLTDFLALAVTFEIEQLTGLLNLWATTKAPLDLRTKYGLLAWEYTTPGGLSTGGPGPTTAEQTPAAVPDAIKQARFNLYLVYNDGSLGVHNPHYCLELLIHAEDLVQQELNK